MNEVEEAQQKNNLKSEHQIPDPHRPEDLVRQFHQVYGLPIKHDQPEVDRERIHMRMRLEVALFRERGRPASWKKLFLLYPTTVPATP